MRVLITSILKISIPIDRQIEELIVKPKVRVKQNKDLAIYLLYQKQQYLVPKVKVAVDFLVSSIKSS